MTEMLRQGYELTEVREMFDKLFNDWLTSQTEEIEKQ
jgi:hypothetical protein